MIGKLRRALAAAAFLLGMPPGIALTQPAANGERLNDRAGTPLHEVTVTIPTVQVGVITGPRPAAAPGRLSDRVLGPGFREAILSSTPGELV